MPSAEDKRFAAAERIIGHRFNDRSLLRRALTHPSVHEGTSGSRDYERLEFLGDAVLGLIVVEDIFVRFPELMEGDMTKLKISAVSGSSLADAAEALGIADLIATGRSEQGTGARGLRSALENVYEALVGAIYLDAGYPAASSFVLTTLGHRINSEPSAGNAIDHPKSALQELIQSRGDIPEYRIVSQDGPPHERRFTAEVLVDGTVAGTGAGATKKEAEMLAATEALKRLGLI